MAAIQRLRPDLVFVHPADRRAILSEAVSLLEYQTMAPAGSSAAYFVGEARTGPIRDPVIALSTLRRMSLADFMFFMSTGHIRG